MPGWHEATRQLQEQGKVQFVGIVQEQHPDRARLFMQWKQMDWPVMVDAFNLLAVGVVPITLLIDEYGVIRGKPRSRSAPREVLEEFLAQEFEPTEVPHDAVVPRSDDAGDEFRLGVTYRMRYDSDSGDAADFGRAVDHWTRACELDPNNYIWMRRLQQYGPRLTKPYPFYDWVDEARAAIEARGERPIALPVEPRGAELATPTRTFEASEELDSAEPDPGGKILRDPGKLVRVEKLSIPKHVEPTQSARVHLEFRPRAGQDAHWNNEVGGLVVWLDPPAGLEVDRRRIVVDPPALAVSDEPRRVEFEVRVAPNMRKPIELPAYALYYVCEGVQGQCLYRRADIAVEIAVVGPS